MAILLNDAGHGNNTWPPSKGTNASGGVPGMAEHDFNAAVTKEIKRLLNGKLRTFEAQPPNGRDVSLGVRINAYNAQHKADRTAIGMSNHGNAGNKKTRGFGVFYWHDSPEAKKLAQRLLAEYKKEFPDMPIWGTGLFACVPGTWTDFYLVRETAAPFVLIEWEFFTNDAARKLMLTSEYRNRCAKVAARTAAGWYGIELDKVTQPSKPEAISKAPSRDYLLHGDIFLSVGALQTGLNKTGIKPPLKVDNIFGDAVEDAVKAFQRANGLEVDGVWGKNSAAKLAAILANLNKPSKPEVTKPAQKEDEEVKNEAIVIGSPADFGVAEVLSARLNVGIYPKNGLPEGKRKVVYLVGATKDGVESDKFVDLSGNTRFDTSEKVREYISK